MYLEHLAFVIKRASWKVTKIHAHLTFEQKRFKNIYFDESKIKTRIKK